MQLSSADKHKLEDFWQHCLRHQYFNVGYPEAADFDYRPLHRFMHFSLNNCGDWDAPSNYILNSFSFEKEVMAYFAELFEIPVDESWGYVTNGGTEGNMFACYLARELFPDGVLYYSRDTHYSVAKIVKLLRMPARAVATLSNGEIDYNDLISKIAIDDCAHPLIFANIGTTMLGAIDNISLIQQRLADLGIARDDYYLHADAALSGMILPFVEAPQPYNFAHGIDSISVSGHKMIGSPIPCGIVVAKRAHVQRISVDVDYISAQDKTISGSRNGHTPLIMWAALRSHSHEQWRRRTLHCLELAQYAVERFKVAGIPAWRNHNSITVIFPRPSDQLCKQHGLASSGSSAHLIATPHHREHSHISRLIDEITADLKASIRRSQPADQRCAANDPPVVKRSRVMGAD